MSTIITNIVNLCTVLLSITFTDRIGRRPIVCIGIGICWLSVLSIGVLGVAPQSGATQKLLVVFACTWCKFFMSLSLAQY
jgi:MFS family permease